MRGSGTVILESFDFYMLSYTDTVWSALSSRYLRILSVVLPSGFYVSMVNQQFPMMHHEILGS